METSIAELVQRQQPPCETCFALREVLLAEPGIPFFDLFTTETGEADDVVHSKFRTSKKSSHNQNLTKVFHEVYQSQP